MDMCGPRVFVETARRLLRLTPDEKVQRTRPPNVADVGVKAAEIEFGFSVKERAVSFIIGQRVGGMSQAAFHGCSTPGSAAQGFGLVLDIASLAGIPLFRDMALDPHVT